MFPEPIPPPIRLRADEVKDMIELAPLAKWLASLRKRDDLIKLDGILTNYRTPKSYHRVDRRIIDSSDLPPSPGGSDLEDTNGVGVAGPSSAGGALADRRGRARAIHGSPVILPADEAGEEGQASSSHPTQGAGIGEGGGGRVNGQSMASGEGGEGVRLGGQHGGAGQHHGGSRPAVSTFPHTNGHPNTAAYGASASSTVHPGPPAGSISTYANTNAGGVLTSYTDPRTFPPHVPGGPFAGIPIDRSGPAYNSHTSTYNMPAYMASLFSRGPSSFPMPTLNGEPSTRPHVDVAGQQWQPTFDSTAAAFLAIPRTPPPDAPVSFTPTYAPPPGGNFRVVRELRLDIRTIDAACLYHLEVWRREALGLPPPEMDVPASKWYAQPEPEPAPAPKRKPGRPRKHPLPQPAEGESQPADGEAVAAPPTDDEPVVAGDAEGADMTGMVDLVEPFSRTPTPDGPLPPGFDGDAADDPDFQPPVPPPIRGRPRGRPRGSGRGRGGGRMYEHPRVTPPGGEDAAVGSRTTRGAALAASQHVEAEIPALDAPPEEPAAWNLLPDDEPFDYSMMGPSTPYPFELPAPDEPDSEPEPEPEPVVRKRVFARRARPRGRPSGGDRPIRPEDVPRHGENRRRTRASTAAAEEEPVRPHKRTRASQVVSDSDDEDERPVRKRTRSNMAPPPLPPRRTRASMSTVPDDDVPRRRTRASTASVPDDEPPRRRTPSSVALDEDYTPRRLRSASTATTQSTDDDVQPQKRGPGRPRKSVAVDTPEAPVKRGRGRPRKVVAEADTPEPSVRSTRRSAASPAPSLALRTPRYAPSVPESLTTRMRLRILDSPAPPSQTRSAPRAGPSRLRDMSASPAPRAVRSAPRAGPSRLREVSASPAPRSRRAPPVDYTLQMRPSQSGRRRSDAAGTALDVRSAASTPAPTSRKGKGKSTVAVVDLVTPEPEQAPAASKSRSGRRRAPKSTTPGKQRLDCIELPALRRRLDPETQSPPQPMFLAPAVSSQAPPSAAQKTLSTLQRLMLLSPSPERPELSGDSGDEWAALRDF